MSRKKKKSNKAAKKKQKNQIAKPHDAAFKDLMGRKELAKDFIENNLPEEVLEIMDLETMERKDGTCVGKNLEETFTDLIYGVKINGKDAYISLLLEHKSRPDRQTIFQVSRYILDAWTKLSKDNQAELPVVIPIVFYHGTGKWNYRTDIRDMIPGYYELPEYLKERIPTMRHDIIDMHKNPDSDLEKYRPITRLVLKVFKYVTQEDEDKLMEVFLIALEEAFEEEDEETVVSVTEVLMVYVSVTDKDITEEKLVKKIEELGGKGSKLMTILEEREQKGIERGRQEGELKRARETAIELIKMGLNVEQIMTATKLPKEEIETLRKEISS